MHLNSSFISGATAVLYLPTTEKRTITFSFAFALIIFNDVFAAITTYYIDDVVLNTFDRVLHFSFYLIYLFAITEKVENLSTDQP
jgi:hypothetical protein